MLQAITGFLGVIVGLVAKPFSDWISYFLNRKQRNFEKKQKQIEDAYYLSQNLIKWGENLGILIAQAYFLRETGKGVENSYKNTEQSLLNEEMNKLKYILLFDLKISSENTIIKKINDIKSDVYLGMRLALRAFTKYLSPELPEDQLIKENFDGDSLKMASFYHKQVMEKINSLIFEIENFLKSEKLKIE